MRFWVGLHMPHHLERTDAPATNGTVVQPEGVTMKTAYLLLTKHATPGGGRQDWELFESLKDAKAKLKIYERQTKQYEGLPLIAPILAQSVIVKVEVV